MSHEQLRLILIELISSMTLSLSLSWASILVKLSPSSTPNKYPTWSSEYYMHAWIKDILYCMKLGLLDVSCSYSYVAIFRYLPWSRDRIGKLAGEHIGSSIVCSGLAAIQNNISLNKKIFLFDRIIKNCINVTSFLAWRMHELAQFLDLVARICGQNANWWGLFGNMMCTFKPLGREKECST